MQGVEPHLSITPSAGDSVHLPWAMDSSTAFPQGAAIETKLQERIHHGLFVPIEIILASEQGASTDTYLKNLSLAPASDPCCQLL